MKFFSGLITGGLISFSMWALIGMAFAEDSPQVRALSGRLNIELNTSMQCTITVFTLQDQLTVAQSEIKRLSEKYEPKKDDAAKP